MKPTTDLGERILTALREKGGRLELDHLSYMTGASMKEVHAESSKLASLDLVNIEGQVVMLRQVDKFSKWDSLKK